MQCSRIAPVRVSSHRSRRRRTQRPLGMAPIHRVPGNRADLPSRPCNRWTAARLRAGRTVCCDLRFCRQFGAQLSLERVGGHQKGLQPRRSCPSRPADSQFSLWGSDSEERAEVWRNERRCHMEHESRGEAHFQKQNWHRL